jgi:hypothetical protein
VRLPPEHGTPGAIRRHYREKSPLCTPCSKAQTVIRKEQRDAARAGRPEKPEKPKTDLSAALARIRAYMDTMEVQA